jgi:RNA polymerase sigma-70 factor (ECF subfamily)
MDEAAAVARARAGDDEAFRHLVGRHSTALFRLAYRMTGNEHDAEDVVQDAFLKAYRSLDRFEDRSQVGSWLYRIATNCAFDLLRARQRRERHLVSPDRNDDDDTTPDAPSGAPDPERIAASGDIRRRVDAAMSRMSARERAAFVLRHFEGRSLEETGEALGMDVNSTKQSVLRAVRKVRQVLAPLATPEGARSPEGAR